MALDASSLYYVKVVSFFLKTVGAWPTDAMNGKPRWKRWTYLFYLKMQASACLIGTVHYLGVRIRTLSFVDLGDKLVCLFLTILTWYRISLPFDKKYENITNDYVKKFHLIHFKEKGSYNSEIFIKIDRLSRYFALIMTTWSLFSAALFNMAPIYNNYRLGAFTENRPANYTLEFSLYYTCPGLNPEDHYVLITMYNYWLAYICTIVVCLNDIYLTLLVFQIIGHIKTLNHDLYHFPKPKVQTAVMDINGRSQVINSWIYDTQENMKIRSRIIEMVEHHRLIVSFTGELSDFFGPMLGLNYLFQSVACCLLLLECSQEEAGALARYGPLTVVIFYQLVQLSVTFEVVGSESEKLKDAVYAVPWESMDVPNQRAVAILLKRVQTPINVTAMGMTPVGVETMVKILKATFSYYAFLRTF